MVEKGAGIPHPVSKYFFLFKMEYPSKNLDCF